MSTTKITPAPLTRSLADVARDIIADWSTDGTASGVWFGAVPYVRAMIYLDTMPDDGSLAFSFGDDRADDVVLRFLSNSATWRGPTARAVKTELRAALAWHQQRGQRESMRRHPAGRPRSPRALY